MWYVDQRAAEVAFFPLTTPLTFTNCADDALMMRCRYIIANTMAQYLQYEGKGK